MKPLEILDSSQRLALSTIFTTLDSGNFDQHILVSGIAGSGKSSVIKAAVMSMILRKDTAWVTAFTPRAASKLREGLGDAFHVQTVDQFFNFKIDQYGHININPNVKPRFTKGDVIFIDECGMLDADSAKYIVELAEMAGCLLIMAGDSYQIPHIDNFRYIQSPIFDDERLKRVELKECYRQADEGEDSLFYLASAIRNSIDGSDFPNVLSYGCVEVLSQSAFVEAAALCFKEGKDAKIIRLSGAQNQLDGLNQHVKDKVFPKNSKSAFQVGEPLITLENFQSEEGYIAKHTDLVVESVGKTRATNIGLIVNEYYCKSLHDSNRVTISAAIDIVAAARKHRELVTDLSEANKNGEVSRANQLRKSLNEYKRLAVPVSPAFAVSVSNAQGSDYDHVFLDLSGVSKKLDRQALLRMIYVAVSRARKTLTITGSFRSDL